MAASTVPQLTAAVDESVVSVLLKIPCRLEKGGRGGFDPSSARSAPNENGERRCNLEDGKGELDRGFARGSDARLLCNGGTRGRNVDGEG
jgi:hypothetical protein